MRSKFLFHAVVAEKANLFLWYRITSDEFEVWDEAQCLPDGLTIKHVHFETGTPAFLIQHCLGTDDLILSDLFKNGRPSVWRFKSSKRPKQKNECAISKFQPTMERL